MLKPLRDAVLKGDQERAAELTEQALSEGVAAEKIMNEALIAAMGTVGAEFEAEERNVPEMLISAEAMKGAMEILRPKLAEAGVKARGKVLIGTVEGDIHDIGKNLVLMMVEGAGFEVVDLGIEVPAEEFVEAVRKEKPDILGMSALLTTTMVYMEDVIQALKDAGLRDQVKVMLGGAPVTQAYADEIGADGYAGDSTSAVELVKRLLPQG
ncbi:MAG: corrinoid protein [Candidatus Bipolaricaulota bacterium]